MKEIAVRTSLIGGAYMKRIDAKLRPLLNRYMNSDLVLEAGTRHLKIRNRISGDFLPVAGSASDHRAVKNFEADLRRLVACGQGLIFAKTGHLPA
jgi:hypothetical protein